MVIGARREMFRRPGRRAALGPVTPSPRGSGFALPAEPAWRRAAVAASLLAAVAVAMPVGLAALPGGFERFGSRAAAIAVLGLLILAPALVGLAAALRGLDRLLAGLRRAREAEYRRIVVRILGAAAALVYVMGLAVAFPGAALAPCLALAALALVAAWLFLLHAMLDAAAPPLRRAVALAADVGLVSGFLHAGGALTAVWFPAYFWIIAQHAESSGRRGLAVSAGLSALGFAAAAATSGFWLQQPALFGGALAALLLLPAHEAALIRRLARARARADAARAAQREFLTLASRDLRAPGEIILELCSNPPSPPGKALAAIGASAGALLARLDDAVDSARLEAGDPAPQAEAFDLHALIHGVVTRLRPQAAARHLALAARIDPRLPYRLRGFAPQLRRVLLRVIGEAIERSDGEAVRVSFERAGADGERVRLRVKVRAGGAGVSAEEIAEDAQSARRGLGAGLAVIERLIVAMGGRAERSLAAGRDGALTIELPLAIDRFAAAVAPDLAERPILVVTEDPHFAEALAEPLAGWRGDPRWIGGGEAALATLCEAAEDEAVPLVIVDGRDDVLAALSWAQRAMAARPAAPPLILFFAGEPWIDSLFELADGALAGIVPAPLSSEVLANALHALPPPGEARAARPAPKASEPAAGPEPVVTRLAAHPRFGGEGAAPIDRRAVEALCSLGRGSDFFRGLTDAFRSESREILARIGESAAAVDAAGFREAVDSLRNCAANVAGARLCELLRALAEVSERELGRHGAGYVERIGSELAKLESALADYLDAAEEASL